MTQSLSDIIRTESLFEKLKRKIKGTKRLIAAKVNSTDLRGGAALVTAALVAKGKTEIENIEYILRGYENLDTKLKNIGVNIISN